MNTAPAAAVTNVAAPSTAPVAKPEHPWATTLSWRETEAKCCLDARVRRNCFCHFVVDCPRHGERHVGTHD